MISFNDFKRIELRVGEVISVESVPNADKLYVLQVDIGGKQVQLVAGLRPFYKEDEIKGKKIVVVANLEPAKIRGLDSDGMLLAASGNEDVSLLTVDKDIPVGSVIS